jgi:hypothetical protein
MTERVIVPHTCLILDLITTHKKRCVLYGSFGPAIQKVSILSGIVRVDNREDILQFIIVRPSSPAASPFLTSSEPEVSD